MTKEGIWTIDEKRIKILRKNWLIMILINFLKRNQ